MRRRTMLGLAAVVLAAAAITASLPASATGAVHVSVTGRVHVMTAQTPSGGYRNYTTLATRGHAWRLQLPPSISAATGTVLRVSGSLAGGTLTADKVRPIRLAPAVSTTGVQKVYVIRVHWAGDPSDNTTTAQVTAAMQQTSAWFNEVSYGRLSGLTVAQDATDESIAAPDSCDVPTGTTQIFNRAVAAAHIDQAQYNHVVIYYPEAGSGCAFAGLADVNGNQVFLNGDLSPRVITHEMGHNLGLNHSHSLSCHAAGLETTISTSCDPIDEYGDPADTMGSEGVDNAGHFNAAQKARLGWLSPTVLQNTVPCTTAPVQLQPYETLPTTGLVAATVDAGADPATYQPVRYWLEFRHPATGVDLLPPTGPLPSGLTDGVLLHLTDPNITRPFSPDTGSMLLDGTTADNSYDFSDAAIPANTTVATPQGYTFDVGSVATSAAVTVSTTKPSPPRALSAVRNGTGVQLAWQPPACPGTGASIASYRALRVGASPVTVTRPSALVPGIPGVGGATYLVSATNSAAATGPAALVPASAPTITGRSFKYSNGVQFSFAPSLSNGAHQIAYYVAHAKPVNGAPKIDESYYSVSQGGAHKIFLLIADGDTYKVTVAPVFADFTRGPASAAVKTTGK